MATYLYRLGRWCARHAWAVIALWVLVLASVGGAAATLSKPLTSEIKIPGTEFQTVLDDLKTEIPAAAGGVGTVVFQSTDGKAFTAAQTTAIQDTIKKWQGVDGVRTGIDPFATQARLDSAPEQLAQGQRQVTAGETQLATAKAQVATAQKQLDGGRAALDARRTQVAALPAGSAQRTAAETALKKAEAQLTAQANRLAPAKAQVEAGQARLDAARMRLEVGTRQAKLSQGMRVVSDTGEVAVGQVIFDDPINDVPIETRDAIPALSDPLSKQGVDVSYSSDMVRDIAGIMGPGEILGLAVAAVVLLVLLGSFVAAGLPLLNALIGVAGGVLATLIFTHWFPMNSVTPALALMLGLAVGIDYTLFLVNRHREQLARGVALEESIGRANGTSGSAVLFAGLTVVVALAALTLTGIPFLGVLGLSAAGTVAIAVLVALTLTPALLHLIGGRVLSRRGRRKLAAQLAEEEAQGRQPADAHPDAPAQGWGGRVTRHPILVVAGVTGLLLLMAIPAASLRLGLPDGGSDPTGSTGNITYTAVADDFGPGANGPIIAVGKLAKPVSADAAQALTLDVGERFKDVPGVRYVLPVGTSQDRDTVAFQIVPTTGPGDEETVQLVDDLRSNAARILGEQDMTLGYTGQTVANIDISKRLADALPLYLGVVVGISLLLLLLVFRSIVVPLVATAGFLLSVAAAFGAVVAVYQWGWLGSLFGVHHPGAILSFLPTLVIGVLFGLAMDYQMFLVTGMREAWAHGQDARTAVRTGLSHGARVVAAAALIMTAVFAGFIHAELTMIRPIGFALATGVLIDAFLIRMTLTPAVMHLIGDRAWRLPSWLDRILPDLDVEGTKLVEARESAGGAVEGRHGGPLAQESGPDAHQPPGRHAAP